MSDQILHESDERKKIRELVRTLPPIYWETMRYFASLSFAERVEVALRASEDERRIVREEFKKQFPNGTRSEINMRVLGHFTTVRMDS